MHQHNVCTERQHCLCPKSILACNDLWFNSNLTLSLHYYTYYSDINVHSKPTIHKDCFFSFFFKFNIVGYYRKQVLYRGKHFYVCFAIFVSLLYKFQISITFMKSKCQGSRPDLMYNMK